MPNYTTQKDPGYNCNPSLSKLHLTPKPLCKPHRPCVETNWNGVINVKQLNTLPDIFSILVLDEKRGSFERHSSAVQETRAKVMSYKREVQSWLHTRAGQIDGKCRTIGDLQTHRMKVILKSGRLQ